MRMVQCANNHFYDSDKFGACPFCGPSAGNERTVSLYSQQGTAGRQNMRISPQGQSRNPYGAPAAGQVPGGAAQSTVSSYIGSGVGVNPVVGWLVAVQGPYMGEDFRLKAGENYIGRSSEMDIQLGLDISVSRYRHGIVVYDAEKKYFYARPGEARQHFYVNRQPVVRNIVLQTYDILTLGSTQLMFIGLCGERFNWGKVR